MITRVRANPPSGDVVGLLATVLVVSIVCAARAHYDNWINDLDILGFFLPNFGYLGDRLGSFELPLWNSHEAGGFPSLGNPSAGWLYLPVMATFPFFEVLTAFKVMYLIECLIAATGTYVLARKLAFSPISAMMVGSTFSIVTVSGFATTNSTVYGQAFAFLPPLLLGIEGAYQTSFGLPRLSWALLAGFSGAQILAAWPGQGALYPAMLATGWGMYRLVFAIGDCPRVRWIAAAQVAAVATTSALMLSWSLLAGLKLFSDASTIPGGDYSKAIGSDYVSYTVSFRSIFSLLTQDFIYWRGNFVSSILIVLGVIATVVAPKRNGALFFALSAFILLDLAVNESWTRDLFYLFPGLEHLHSHRPLASMAYATFPLLMLGGAGLDLVLKSRARIKMSLACPFAVGLFALVAWSLRETAPWFGWTHLWLTLAGGGLVLLSQVSPTGLFRRFEFRHVASLGLVVLILVYPVFTDIAPVLRDPTAAPEWTRVLGKDQAATEIMIRSMARTDPGTAAEFLQNQVNSVPPFRYAPFTGFADGTGTNSSTNRRTSPNVLAILTNGRSMRLDLEQISGYNPLHLKFYNDVIDVMNDAPQDYHWLDLMAPALDDSQLLDMLNVRYVIVPKSTNPQPQISRNGLQVYQDELVSIYENPGYFDRAWIVHEVLSDDGIDILQQIDSRQVDGRVIAFVSGEVPFVASPVPNGVLDRVVVTSSAPEQMILSASTSADGLVVVSEAYAEGWNAYVDGKKVDILRTNHALRGIPITAGVHTIVMKYEPSPILIGLWATGTAASIMPTIWIWSGIDWFRTGRRQRKLAR